MNIRVIEQRYQTLLRQFQVGQIDESTFFSEVARLECQDAAGGRWRVEPHSGAWQSYDARRKSWYQAQPEPAALRPATERQTGQRVEPHPNRRAAPTGQLLTVAKAGLGLAAAFIITLLLMAWPGGDYSTAAGPALAPSPRPPIFEEGGSRRDGGPTSAIFGKVVDASTGQAGAGMEVNIVGAGVVRTDTDGSYSVTGLRAGQYVVALQADNVARRPAPVPVSVDGQSSYVVDVAYFSNVPVAPTNTPPAVAAAPVEATPAAIETPATLPTAGAPLTHRSLALIGAGLLFVGLGGMTLRGRRA
jgi:hypothetical protein